MEKQTLREQLAYLLNIDPSHNLSNYSHIAGTQASPTMVLIDGLNEAAKAEDLWREVLDISKTFEPGSLKFVVTSRANSKSDIDRYALAESDELFIFRVSKELEQIDSEGGDSKIDEHSEDTEVGLSKYTHWLTALNMAEMKNAWDTYVQKDKNKYKPQFSFDDLATFDRALYNQISNPLVLRLFLETYHNKTLPKKGNKHLNIWADWLATFTDAEQEFFNHMGDVIWENGENELLLDDILKNNRLKPYFTDDRINAPYPRLKNNGWISRYVKDLNAYVAFTVEGALLYLLGIRLKESFQEIDIHVVQKTIKSGTELQRSAIESFLGLRALMGDLTIVCELIKGNDEYHDVFISPLLLNLKTFGAKATLAGVLLNSIENEWTVLFKLDQALEEMEMHIIRMEFLEELMPLNPLQSKEEVWLGLKSCLLFDLVSSKNLMKIINESPLWDIEDVDLLSARADVECNIGEYDKALISYQKCLEIELVKFGEEHPSVAAFYGNVGWVWENKGEYNKALEFYHNSLSIQLNTLGIEDADTAISYGHLGALWHKIGDFDKSIEFYQKGLNILIKKFGLEHSWVALSYNNIGDLNFSIGDFARAKELHNKCLSVLLKTVGEGHSWVATSYNNIGNLFFVDGDYEKSLDFYKKGLEIQLKIHGDQHFSVAIINSNIGQIFFKKGLYEEALVCYVKGLEIQLKNIDKEHADMATWYLNVGHCHYKLENYSKAFDLISKCIKINFKARIISFIYGLRRKLIINKCLNTK
jgi:tetratricopeptide (TPR) repeat protein